MQGVRGAILVAGGSAARRRIVIQAIRESNCGDHEFLESDGDGDLLRQLAEAPSTRLVFLDWNRNGAATLRAIRADPVTRGIPVIVTTREAERAGLVEAIQAGATNWLVEPFDRRTIQEKVEAALEG